MYFKNHVFFCLNDRGKGQTSCSNFNSRELQAYAKDRLKNVKIIKNKTVRINKAGCLGRCDDGPVLVVYPEGVWYQFIDKEDIDEIIDSHLVNGVIVERLLI
jgi:(2Fe-2S) ferredoxin